jgi:hypothetical protein
MWKPAKLSATLLALLFMFGGGQMESDCNAGNIRPSWRTKLQNGSIFFPYSWCLAFKVLGVGPHTTRECKIDCADLDVKAKVEYVLRDGGEKKKFVAYDGADDFKEQRYEQVIRLHFVCRKNRI